MTQATINALYIYPIKSCRGISVRHAEVLSTGLRQDRRWMLVNDKHSFVTQREQPRMALIAPELKGEGLLVSAPEMPPLTISGVAREHTLKVAVWRDQVSAFDEGEVAAQWFSKFLGMSVRLVRFDDAQSRLSSSEFTGDASGCSQFADGFALLVIATASLADLNARLTTPLPMNRFRPNLVLDGLPAYGEDQIHELRSEALALRLVKPCTRCKITTTDQVTGVAQGPEPLSTLMKYRRSAALRGVTFGQNAIVVAGPGAQLTLGQPLQAIVRA